MRCADFGPTPGRQRNDSISRASVGVYFIGAAPAQNGKLHAGRKIEPGHESRILFLGARRDLAHRIVDRGRTTRSSSMSLSSPSSFGSIVTLFASCGR
jgi:hypothetical protein